MKKTPKPSYPFFCFIFSFILISLLPLTAHSHNILFYYNSSDGTDGALLQCVTILESAGNQVTPFDVHGVNHDPTFDNWGAPYDQVWDMRFVERDSRTCGSGLPGAADYFDGHWRNKAVSFLNYCGKLFIAGEHYTLVDRDEGLYLFLKEIQAVKPGYDPCAPSPRGNSSTTGEAFYTVRHGLGPVSFYGAWVGGIPLVNLAGTDFVDTKNDWEGDSVDRSIVSGWEGGRLGGAVTAGLCNRGKLFMVWDATMWTLWQPGMYNENKDQPPIWDDSAWFSGEPREDIKAVEKVRKAKKITQKFFPAIANWLGSRNCPCTETATLAISPPVRTALVQKPPQPLPTLPSAFAKVKSLLSAGKPVSTGIYPPSSNAPLTIVFGEFPVNIYMLFRDGPGEYQLNIWDHEGHFVQTVFERPITTQKDSWASWDGTNQAGKEAPLGIYDAVLSKDGRVLRKIVLSRIKP